MTPIIGSDYPKKVIPLIDKAKKNIDIAVFDWRWYPDDLSHSVSLFNSALVRARNRGVVVRCVTDSALLGPVLSSVDFKWRQLSDRRTLHAKFLIIDSKILIIGSHNFTKNAFGSNIEASVVVDIPEGQTRFIDFFNNLFGL